MESLDLVSEGLLPPSYPKRRVLGCAVSRQTSPRMLNRLMLDNSKASRVAWDRLYFT